MVTAELGDDVYAEDPTVNDLEARAARILGKQSACLMPSGTMSNLASILAHCPRGSKVIVGDDSDIYVYEAGGASVCGGVMYHPVANQPDGTLDLTEVENAFPPDPDDPQFAAPALLCLENPQNHTGGRVLPMSYLADVSAWARERRLRVHIDGARIFNAALSLDVPVADIAAHGDSVQFCLSKGLGAPVGSMVVGTTEFIGQVRRVRKMLGGGLRQSGVLAAAGIVALDNRARLIEDHETARRFAAGLAEIPGITVDGPETAINMVFFRISSPKWDTGTFLAAARDRGVYLAELGTDRIRSVTHHGVSPQDIDYALDVISALLQDESAPPASVRRTHDGHSSILTR
jgi:threonine aldolase